MYLSKSPQTFILKWKGIVRKVTKWPGICVENKTKQDKKTGAWQKVHKDSVSFDRDKGKEREIGELEGGIWENTG